jgi:glutaminyl-peptide cyclotransferase
VLRKPVRLRTENGLTMLRLFLLVGLAGALAAILFVALSAAIEKSGVITPETVKLDVWNGQRAMDDIAAQVAFGPRAMGTPGHQKVVDYIQGEFAKLKISDVKLQQGSYADENRSQKELTNIVAQLDPNNPKRLVLGTHYDSIIRAYRDKEHPDGYMPGANNSASGVALLLETARALSVLPKPPFGVDFIFFDGEEGPKSLGAGDPDWRALGSPWFASHLKEIYPHGNPAKGAVFDMVCARDLALKPELASRAIAPREVDWFWELGRALAPKAFLREPTAQVIGDDQLALTAAGIPSFLVIDFDYEPWFNTTQDTIDKCSAASLETVGRTVLQYLYAKQERGLFDRLLHP